MTMDPKLVTLPVELVETLLCQSLANQGATQPPPAGPSLADEEIAFLQKGLREERDLRALTGSSVPMRQVRAAIQQVARTDATVLILGETGTGKELVARAIHQLSPRRSRLFVPINCAAMPAHLLPSELFGHEAGAFTGAVKRRIGRFELAHQGTIFLDEIGEVPLETQVTLLRVLQERVIERLGAGQAIPVDVRVIAATHRDLSLEVQGGRFRADLFYRLNVFPIAMPPLRLRPSDVPDLVRHFLLHFNRRMQKEVAQVEPATLETLVRYSWPGNVRELENLIERAMILTEGPVLRIDPGWLSPVAPATPPGGALVDAEKQMIQQALERSGGKVYGPHGAAAALGLKPTTLYGRMQKHGIGRRRPNEK